MKKILLPILAFIAMAFTTNAQTDVSGTYDGELIITLGNTALPAQDESVTLEKEEGAATYKVSVIDLEITVEVSTLSIGTIAIGGIEATEEEGVVNLTKEGAVEVPESPVQGTTASLGTSSVSGNILTLNLNVEVPGVGTVLVNFVGNTDVSGIFTPKTAKAKVYPTIVGAEGLINVIDFETGNYVIYYQTGAAVKSGKFNAGSISVSDLNAGVYVLSVNGTTTTFIKK